VSTFDGFVHAVYDDPAALPESELAPADEALARGHGYLARRDEWSVFCATLDDVWLPGLSAMGLDPAALASRYPRASGA
jgi:hypothetical protein